MFFKFVSTLQAIVLTAAMVHIYHLQRQVDNNTIKFQLQENNAIEQPAPVVAPAPRTYQPEDFELLPDIQTIQDEILDGENTALNHSAALFGDMKEKS